MVFSLPLMVRERLFAHVQLARKGAQPDVAATRKWFV